MGFTGLVPSEYSSGETVVRRGHITKAGSAHLRTQLIESAWAYQHRPLIAGAVLIEAYDEWQVAERRYLSEGSMAKLAPTGDDGRLTEGGEEGDRRTRRQLATSSNTVTEVHDDALIPRRGRRALTRMRQGLEFGRPWMCRHSGCRRSRMPRSGLRMG